MPSLRISTKGIDLRSHYNGALGKDSQKTSNAIISVTNCLAPMPGWILALYIRREVRRRTKRGHKDWVRILEGITEVKSKCQNEKKTRPAKRNGSRRFNGRGWRRTKPRRSSWTSSTSHYRKREYILYKARKAKKQEWLQNAENSISRPIVSFTSITTKSDLSKLKPIYSSPKTEC